MMNNKAVSKALVIIVLFVIVGLIAAAWASSGNAPAPKPTSGLLVTFDGTQQSWNDTYYQNLNWATIAPAMSYTKNVTVTNLNPTAVTLIFYTKEPAGSVHTWPRNNTVLSANYTTSSLLTLTTAPQITVGEYQWLLVGSNSTTQATPTPNPSGTTAKQNCTVNVNGAGISNIKVSNINAGGSYIITTGHFPYTFQFTSGDTLKFEAMTTQGYTFNAYTFSDGTFPQDNPILTLEATDTFTITAEALLTGP